MTDNDHRLQYRTKKQAHDLAPHIEAAREAGHETLRAIAGFLNSRGFTTHRGNPFDAVAVKRIMERAEQFGWLSRGPMSQSEAASRAHDRRRAELAKTQKHTPEVLALTRDMDQAIRAAKRMVNNSLGGTVRVRRVKQPAG